MTSEDEVSVFIPMSRRQKSRWVKISQSKKMKLKDWVIDIVENHIAENEDVTDDSIQNHPS